MRSRYPLSSKKNQVEFEEIQEQLIYLIGSDTNVFDNNVDVSGVYDILDSQIDASGQIFIYNNVYKVGAENDVQG